jgi:WD40 repeat protein
MIHLRTDPGVSVGSSSFLCGLLLLSITISPLQGQERRTIPLPELHPVVCLVVSPNGRSLVTVQDDDSLRLWDLKTGKQRGVLQGEQNVMQRVAWAPDGSILATRYRGGGVKLWDARTLKPRGRFGDPTLRAYTLIYSPDGKRLAVAGSIPRGRSFDDRIQFWNVPTGRQVFSLKGHGGYTTCLAFSSDGRTLYSGGRDGIVKAWDLKAGKEQASYQVLDHPVNALAVTPDGKYLAAAGDAQGIIVLWDLARGRLHRRLTNCGRYPRVVRFTPDGKTLLAGGRREVQVFDVASGKRTALLEGHRGRVDGLVLSRDGRTIITTDGLTVKFWDLPTNEDE